MLHGFGDLRVEEVSDPRPGPGEVVVDVACVQLSVTECAFLSGEDVYGRAFVADLLARRGPQPLLGHEFCGHVAEFGEGVMGFAIGDYVTAVEIIPCGACAACLRGYPYDCPRYQVVGFHRPGALAEKIVLPASALLPLPARLSIHEGAALQPLSAAVMTHDAAHVQTGETVAFIGSGVMGLLGVQVARNGGAGLIALVGRDNRKLSLGERFGARLLVRADETDPVAAVLEATRGLGADVVFETAGGSPLLGLSGTETLDQAVAMVRRGGRVVQVGVLPNRAEAPLGLMREKFVHYINPPTGLRSHTPVANTHDLAVRLVLDGRAELEPLITHRLQGLESVSEAIAITMRKREHGAINPAQIVIASGE